MWVALLSGQATQREVALKYGVDRSTVVSVCKAAKTGALTALAARPGRPGMTPEQAELAEARAEIERLKATVTEQAVAPHLHQGKRVGTERRPGPLPGGRHRQGRPAGPDRPRRAGGLVDPARLRTTRRGPGPGPPLAGQVRRARPARADRCRPWRWGGARNPRAGAGRDHRAVPRVGRGRPFAPQARPPRLAAGPGARRAVDDSAGPGRRRHCPAGQSTS
jgi:transposase-like protein